MTVQLTVPSFGESITEVAIEEWLVAEGEYVKQDDPMVSIESDKATLEVPSPSSGVVTRIHKKNGDWVKVGDVIADIDETASAGQARPAAQNAQPAASSPVANTTAGVVMGPAARHAASASNIDPSTVMGTGPKGRLLKEDVLAAARGVKAASAVHKPAPSPPVAAPARLPPQAGGGERLVPMTPIRRVIARRLVQATQTTAMLTTFNEVDMSRVIELRTLYKQAFANKYGIKLGFMSFFVKAAVEALAAFPAVNAEVRDTDIVYKDFYDIGVAVGSKKGLMVPVIRGADRLSFAEVEQTIADFGRRAQSNKLKIDELQGGTFTISNGGIYGSMMSTPILNPPQSGILGMHNILKRPMVIDDEIVIRPMMYVALTYDHRIVDGRGAVGFLVRLKECVENPDRILLAI